MRALVLALCLVAVAAQAKAQEIHSDHCLYGCPAGAPVTNDLIVREIYVLSSNDTTKFADWTAYRVTEDTIGPTQSRNFKKDPLLAGHET
jgi:endonuclease G